VRHDGSVNAAAKAMGVPQPTLAQLVSGEVTNPRIDTIRRIAQHFRASEAWLISGAGDAPIVLTRNYPRAAAALLDWDALFDALVLAPADTAVLVDLPRAMLRFGEDIGFVSTEMRDADLEDLLRDYIHALTRIWQRWITAVGPQRSASIIRSHRAALLLMTYVAPRAILEQAEQGDGVRTLTLESLDEAYQAYKQAEWEHPSSSDPTGPIALVKQVLAKNRPPAKPASPPNAGHRSKKGKGRSAR